ncbi:MAG TPA: ABC transporter permease [Micromonosporaceae bacterium]
MFIALRDLRFARGRFALLSGVIALMTLMVVLLTGLTDGLRAASISAVAALPVDAIAFDRPEPGQAASFASSTLPADAAGRLARQPGVRAAFPLGVATARLTHRTASTTVAVLGADPGLYPELQSGHIPGGGGDEVAVSADLARERSITVGDRVDLGGIPVTVTAIVAATTFNHLPVAYLPLATWQAVAHTETVTAVALTGPGADPAAIGAATGTWTVSREEAFAAVGGYSSEQGSLNLMRALLFAISALVVGAFFTVWTMQRAPDLAVVRALGAGRGYLLRDALGQAIVVLAAGALVGGGAGTGLGALAATVMPFQLTLATVGTPLCTMILVGLLGAAASVRQVTTVDPLTALGATR